MGVRRLLHLLCRHLSVEVCCLADSCVLSILALLKRSLKSLLRSVHLVDAFLQFRGVLEVQFYRAIDCHYADAGMS